MNSNVRTANPTALAVSTAMLLACVLVFSNAFAADEVSTETVKFQDLNVGTPAGVEALYRRIHAAAEHVCTRPGQRWAILVAAACARGAEAEGIAKVNLPSLTAYYEKRTGGHPQALAANR